MAKEENLILGGKAHSLSVDEASKGGKKSGEVRKQKAQIRKSIEMMLNAEYKMKDGTTVTGMDAIAMSMFKTANDPKNKNNVYAAKYLLELLGQSQAPLDAKEQKARIKIMETQAKQMQSGTETQFSKLDEILDSLKETAHADNIESETK